MDLNSMKTKWNRIRIDPRSEQDVEEEIEELAASYTPEWHFDSEDPDIGTVIAKIFAEQMSGNISRCNQVLEKYHIEFVNMLGLTLGSPRPAKTTVIINPVPDSVAGVEVPKGTKLLADTDSEGGQLIFETLHDLYATGSTIDHIFMTLRDSGKIIPLKGSFSPANLEPESEEETEPMEFRPFGLFDEKETGIEQNSLFFYHSTVLDVEQDSIFVKIEGNRKLLEAIRDGEFVFRYYTDNGFVPVESVEVLPDEDLVILRKERENARVELDGRQYSILELKALCPIKEAVHVDSMSVSSSGRSLNAEFANDGTQDFDVDSFDPFGDTLSLYEECYIGQDAYFKEAGSTVRITFDLEMETHRVMAPVKAEDDELKVIKRKPKAVLADMPADARVDEISLEYFNGTGWKRLECDSEYRYMFATDDSGTCELTFRCPDDWEPTVSGAYTSRCIRMRLLKSDNCYMNPCVYHYPRINNLKISFSYGDTYVQPQRLAVMSGTKSIDLTDTLRTRTDFIAFDVSDYRDDALYLGFDRKLENGPIGLLFELDDNARGEGIKCQFFCSSSRGFQQMKVIDQTVGMSRSGIIRFIPPADFSPMTLEGKTVYWIKIRPDSRADITKADVLPRIQRICFNAVEAANVETLPEQDFYLEATGPNLEVNLGVTQILDVELWVNEKESLSRQMMDIMLRSSPESVRAEYDLMGEITSFFVKWEEADCLDITGTRRCYLLDRLNSTLTFGDGITSDFPRVTDDVTFKAVIRRCNGEEGNVEPDQIASSMDNLMFVDSISNPVKGYGGSSMESLDAALHRGANILKSRKRLVSMDDYVQEILGYSDQIAQVKGLTGYRPDGERDPRALTFLILMKDFDAGAYSFYSLAAPLKAHLQDAAELTLRDDDLYLAEPVYAMVSVDLWVRIPTMDDSLEIQNMLNDLLEEYLDPVRGGRGEGWPIGVLPNRAQLMMRLAGLRNRAVVQRMAVTVSWHDQKGSHEVDLDSISDEKTRFFACRNGRHRIYVATVEEV